MEEQIEISTNKNISKPTGWVKNHKALAIAATVGIASVSIITASLVKNSNKEEAYMVEKQQYTVFTQKETEDPENAKVEDIKNKVNTANAAGGSCNLNASEDCARLVLGETPDGKARVFSDTFIAVMNQAGNTFNVPPAVILAYMAGINSTGRNAYYFSEEGENELIDATYPWWGKLGNCNELDYMEQGAYDWILTHFTEIKKATGADVKLNELAEGRGDIASRCNFLDATYVAAGYFGDPDSKKGCEGYSWDSFKEKLLTLTWGSDRVGAYADDKRYESGGSPNDVFNACR